MVRNVFRLDDRQLASLMVPRGDVVYLDVEEPLEENLRRIEESDHSRFPAWKCRMLSNRGRWPGVSGIQLKRKLRQS